MATLTHTPVVQEHSVSDDDDDDDNGNDSDSSSGDQYKQHSTAISMSIIHPQSIWISIIIVTQFILHI